MIVRGAVTLCLIVAGLALMWRGIYGFTVFLVIPLLSGAVAAWWRKPATGSSAVAAGALAGLVTALFPLAIGIEGAICVVMSIPLTVPLGMLGALLWHVIPKRSAAALFFLPAGTLGWDVTANSPTFDVQTAIEINAPPERVWNHVVTFAELPEPHEWFFKAGLAYPKRARIEGTGVGAVRYCEFSTGPFVEPITTWQEPSLLRFRVTENPAPMHEWSPYSKVLPKHLHGYMVSKQGQFKLISLPGGRTLLEGTTWYQHGLLPAPYWRLWSDAIIHRIHLRVLNHIKGLSESTQTGTAAR